MLAKTEVEEGEKRIRKNQNYPPFSKKICLMSPDIVSIDVGGSWITTHLWEENSRVGVGQHVQIPDRGD